MKKLFLTLFAITAALTGFAQTNLAVGHPSIASSGNAGEGNDGNTGTRWESTHSDPQTWQVDLEEAQTFNTIRIIWEGAYSSTFQIIAGDEVGDDGYVVNGTTIYSIEGQTLSGPFPYTQIIHLDAPVTARYVMFNGTARGTGYGHSFWEFEIMNVEEEMVVTTLTISAEKTNLVVGDNMPITVVAKDQIGGDIEPGTITWSSSDPAVGTVTDGVFTALAAGTTTITAAVGEVVSNNLIMNVAAEATTAPTTNATEPTDLAVNVIPVYSATYGKGLNDSNPGWGVGGGAPNPLYTSISEEVLVEGDSHKTVHVKGAGMNSRTQNAASLTADYSTVHVAVYPYSATSCKIFEDNAYGTAVTYNGLVPGQWNYVVIDNVNFSKNYICIELVNEYEFYLDHFYFAKPAVDDAVAPTLDKAELVQANTLSVELALKGSDDLATNIIYVITDQNNKQYTATGANGAEINHTIMGLAANTAYTFTVKAEDENGNFSEPITVQATTNAYVAAPAPTTPVEDVMSVYSEAYTSSAPNIGFDNWGSRTQFTGIEIEGNPTLQFVDMDYYGIVLNTQLDVTDMKYMHIDLFGDGEGTLGIVPIWWNPAANANFGEIRYTATLTKGEWASIDIPLSAFDDPGRNGVNLVHQIKLDNGNGNSILVDNIYFWTDGEVNPPQPTEMTDEGADENGVHTLTGTWSPESFAAIDAEAKANAYDFTAVNGMPQTYNNQNMATNPNALFITKTPGTFLFNEIVAKADGSGYQGYNVQIIDHFMNTADHSVNTSIAPISVVSPFFQMVANMGNVYTTVVLPFNKTLPSNVQFYEITGFDNSGETVEVTLNQVTEVQAGVPYVAHLDGADITLAGGGETTIDWNVTESVVDDSTTFIPTFATLTTSGAKGATLREDAGKNYGMNAVATEVNFTEVTEVPAFRAYVRVNDTATGINDVNTTNKEVYFNIYTIDGKLVRQGVKSAEGLGSGIYIVNGKKVIVK